MDEQTRAELAAISKAARAYLELEAELGVDALRLAAVRTAPVAQAPAAAVVQAARSEVAEGTLPPAPAAPAAARSSAGTAEERIVRLAQLASEAATCTACVLHERRTQTVFARGNPAAELVFVGEGPGAEEDRQGAPFVGPAGQLLDRMIVAMGYARDDVYICNVVKCRPPENRTPRPEEAIACSRFLVPQLELVAPKVIVALGRCAAQNLGVAGAEGAWRGRWGQWQDIPVLPTYHPAFLLRSPEFKRVVWEDLQLVMARLGRSAAPR